MDCYIFRNPPHGVVYKQLIDYCCGVASKMLLVVRDPERDCGVPIRESLAKLKPFLLESIRADNWPGTTLYGHEATVYWFRVNSKLAGSLKSFGNDLFAWLHPEAPEDLGFIRGAGDPILVSISHERDAYMLLDESEKRTLDANFPELGRTLVKEE